MDRTLTVEQRAEVARTVTKDNWQVINWGVVDYVGTPSGTGGWGPTFDGDDDERLQALALVEWLAEYAFMGRISALRFLEAIKDKNIPALELLAHSLITGEEK